MCMTQVSFSESVGWASASFYGRWHETAGVDGLISAPVNTITLFGVFFIPFKLLVTSGKRNC